MTAALDFIIVPALQEAAAHGEAKKPYVLLTLCHSCKGIRLSASATSGLQLQKIVAWAKLTEAHDPGAILRSTIDQMREEVVHYAI